MGRHVSDRRAGDPRQKGKVRDGLGLQRGQGVCALTLPRPQHTRSQFLQRPGDMLQLEGVEDRDCSLCLPFAMSRYASCSYYARVCCPFEFGFVISTGERFGLSAAEELSDDQPRPRKGLLKTQPGPPGHLCEQAA